MARQKGSKLTEEHKRKISESGKGRIAWNKGISPSEETKKKLREARKGRIFSEETKRKMSESGKGRIVSDETRQKLRELNGGEKNYWFGKRGAGTARWKGGRSRQNGYIVISIEGVNIKEHRLVMEQSLGRKLYLWETVHHINGIKDDNRIENLKLLPGLEHNTRVQKVYQENLQLKQRILELELQLIS